MLGSRSSRPPIPGAAASLRAGAIGALLATGFRLSGRTVPLSSTAIVFTPYLAAGSAALGTVAALLGSRRTAGLYAAGAVAGAAVVLPRTRPVAQPRVEPGAGRTVRMMSANCLKGRADPDALVALVRELRPDVLAIQEQNRGFIGRLERADLTELLPHRVLAPGGRDADAGLLAAHPLVRADLDAALPSEFVAARMTLPDGSAVPLMSVHPIPPFGPRRTARWASNLRDVPGPRGPMAGGLVAGDFNGTLDHPEFRALLGRGWRDAGRERGAGLLPTWGGYGVLRLTLDHVLVPPGARVVGYRVDRLKGSDHRVITAIVELAPQD